MSCWILHGCNVSFPLANMQTVATVLNRREYEKKYSHTKIKIKNDKEKSCDIDNKKLAIYDNDYNNSNIYRYIHIYKNIHRLRMRYNANIYTYISYIIMLARQFGERCFQASHNSFWTFSHTLLTVKPKWVFFINLIKHYVNFFNTFYIKMATHFAVSIVYSSCHKIILCFCRGTAHDRYLHVMKRNIIISLCIMLCFIHYIHAQSYYAA